ncbi:MAG TPA: hypothetical protein VHQ92_10145 [Pseudolabrys sp.]|jgi:hypothetical protein|nr:hypothetical protein [Pseudolabrys sp.]
MAIVEVTPQVQSHAVEKPDGAAVAFEAMPAPASSAKIAHTVADIVAGARDTGGEKIDCVYFKRANYAIYRRGTPPQVVMAYSDDNAIADQQIAAVSSLLPLRDRLIHLFADLPPSLQEHYRTQIADALRLGLEKQATNAQALLAEAIEDALAAQSRRGRLVYLQWTGIAVLPAVILIVFGGYYVEGRTGVHLLLMSVGAGAIGAVLSIAIGIRARTVAIEGDWKSNAVDAAVRIGIGMISASVLFLLLNSGLVANLSAGTVALSGSGMSWQVALIVGFAAGFLERLVPDLLDKENPPPKPVAAPAVSGVVTSGNPH